MRKVIPGASPRENPCPTSAGCALPCAPCPYKQGTHPGFRCLQERRHMLAESLAFDPLPPVRLSIWQTLLECCAWPPHFSLEGYATTALSVSVRRITGSCAVGQDILVWSRGGGLSGQEVCQSRIAKPPLRRGSVCSNSRP